MAAILFAAEVPRVQCCRQKFLRVPAGTEMAPIRITYYIFHIALLQFYLHYIPYNLYVVLPSVNIIGKDQISFRTKGKVFVFGLAR